MFPTLGPKRTSNPRQSHWEPAALRPLNLLFAILVCWSFVATLQYFLIKSQNEGGVIFAAHVNNLPLSRSFVYLYLPTIIAVIFSMFWVWIDIDAKRYQPYHQLSKAEGALGKDSLLLTYPFDFLPFVPFFALRNRHWLVLWSSTATVLVTFGIVPLQAGLFSTRTLTRTFPETFALSKAFLDASKQPNELTIRFAQSAYGILTMNETLPAYMDRAYALAPFVLSNTVPQEQETWTAETTMYSLDLQCEQTQRTMIRETVYANSTLSGCGFPIGNMGNYTIDPVVGANSSNPRVNRYSADYAGFWYNTDWSAKSQTSLISLAYFCDNDAQANQTFFAAFSQNKERDDDLPIEPTTLFCRPSYYEQTVRATIDASSKAPLDVVPLDSKRPLSPGVFDQRSFQDTLYYEERPGFAATTQSTELAATTNNLPIVKIPRYLDRLAGKDLTFKLENHDSWAVPAMAAMAIVAGDRDLEDYLDPVVLGGSYEKAYRLLFARIMTDILATDFSSNTADITGLKQIDVEAVVLEPVFTYLVEGLLSGVSMLGLGLLYMSITRKKKLHSDPGTIASTMSLTASDASLLSLFDTLDCCSTKHMQRQLRDKKFILIESSTRAGITLENGPGQPSESLSLTGSGESDVAKPHRPLQFRFFTIVLLISVFLGVASTFAVLFVRSKAHGLPLPSKNKVVQNLIINYIPTAIATLIEPIWIFINRLFCMLQPFEELQDSKARASSSIDLNYSSLPPQLTIIKAIRSSHFTLAIVCAMALLANLLATALAGLFILDQELMSTQTTFVSPFDAKFVSINGSSGPPREGEQFSVEVVYSGAYQGGTGEDQFLVAESNYTKDTPLPFWIDEKAMYLPFTIPTTANATGGGFRARTKFFSAEANCKPIVLGQDYQLQLFRNHSNAFDNGPSTFKAFVKDDNGKNITCHGNNIYFNVGPDSNPMGKKVSGKLSAELVATFVAGPNTTQSDQDTCRSAAAIGWMKKAPATWSDVMNATIAEATSNDTTFVLCQPKLVIGDASIRVDLNGQLQGEPVDAKPDEDQSAQGLDKYFSNGAHNLIAQSNLFLFRSIGTGWHNDSYAGEFMPYFINRAAKSVQFSDPNKPLPQFSDIDEPLRIAYSKLFAIWLGVNKDRLFLPSSSTTDSVAGEILQREERLFFNVPLFIISECILGIYVIVAILVYLRRPGRYLPHMPTSIASIISLFAPSAAVRDFHGTSHFTAKERAEFLEKQDVRYGYGSYISEDGSIHVGIEKVPFVRHRKEVTFLHSKFDQEQRKGTTAGAGPEYTLVGERKNEVSWWNRMQPGWLRRAAPNSEKKS